jgi:P27 family predicted phage terminase small subunit
MGRPRKTQEQLEQTGNFRADRHAGRTRAPKFSGAPARPAGLSVDARKLWDLVVPELIAQRVATALDAPALEAMVTAWGEYKAAQRIKAHDLDDKRKRQMLANAALKSWRDLAAAFGLTPADRAKLEVAPHAEEENPFTAFTGGQGKAG